MFLKGKSDKMTLVGGWTNPVEKYARQIGNHLPRDRGINQKCLKPPPRTRWVSQLLCIGRIHMNPSIHSKAGSSSARVPYIFLPSKGRCSTSILLGCPRKLGSMVSKWVISPTYNWSIPWGYNPLTNHLLTSWDILVPLQSWQIRV